MTGVKKFVVLGVLIALALALHVAERMIPLPILPVPGVKLGLANIVTLVAIFMLSFSEVLLFVVVRTALSSLLGGGLSGFMFSLSGGLFSLVVMYVLLRYANRWLSLPAVSVIGALFHNLGQLLVAAAIVRTLGILLYLPMLIVSAGLTGLAVGFTTLFLLRALTRARLVQVWAQLRPLLDGK